MRALLVCELGLFTGSRDRTIKLWKETETGFEVDKTYVGHASYVTALQYIPAGMLIDLPDGALVSGVSSLQHIHTFPCLCRTLPWTGSCANARLQMTGSNICTLVAGSRDTTVKLWNPSTCECLHTLSDHKYQVRISAISQPAYMCLGAVVQARPSILCSCRSLTWQ